MKIPFLKVTVKASADEPAEMSIRGAIGKYWDSETYSIKDTESDVLDELNKIPKGKKINVRINSPGGQVGTCLGIYNALSTRCEDVTTYNCGYACSSASVLMLAGDKRVSPPSSIWMIHKASADTSGNADDKRKDAEMLDAHDKTMSAIYASKAGGTPEEWLDKMGKETWMTGEEAIQMKLATHSDGDIEDDEEDGDGPTDSFKRVVSTFKHIPENLRSRLVTAKATNLPPQQQTTKKDNMKKVIDALVAAGFTVSAEATEDQVALVISRDVAPIRAENQKHIDARKARVTALLDQAVADKVIVEARKSGLLSFGSGSAEGETEVFAQIADIRAAKTVQTTRGARPVPHGGSDTDTIESLMEEQASAIEQNDPDALAQVNAKLAAKRGRDKIFTPMEERPAYRN